MKINFTMSALDGFGGMRTTNIISNKLVERGHEVTVTLLKPQPLLFNWKARIIFAEDFWRSARRKLSHMTNLLLKVHKYHNIYTVIDSLTDAIPECDINVAQGWVTVFPVLRSKKGIPFHHLQHFEEVIFYNQYDELVQLVRESMYLPLHRTTNSIWCQMQMKKRYGYDLPIINPGIDHTVFYPRGVGKKSHKKRVVCLGKDMMRWKGFEDVIQSMKIVMEKEDNVEFVAFGAIPLARTYSGVPFKFMCNLTNDQLAELYSSADILVCPSWYESFPGPPIEAMACGTPVVTTRYGTEDYAQHEKNSLVVMPRDINGMAEAILRLLSDADLAEKFKKTGPQTAKRFTWDKTVDKFEKLFRMALEERKPSFEDTKIHLTRPVPKGFDENVQLVVKK